MLLRDSVRLCCGLRGCTFNGVVAGTIGYETWIVDRYVVPFGGNTGVFLYVAKKKVGII